MAAACGAASGAACGGTGEELTDETGALTDTLRARMGETTVWIDRQLIRENDRFKIHGRSSRNLTSGNAFVIDDPYGAFAQVGARSFDIAYAATELATLTEGVSLLAGLDFVPSAGRPAHLTARLIARPRLESLTGATTLYLTQELTPVISGGRVVYRIRGTARTALRDLTAEAAGVALSDVRLVDPTHFEIDLLFDHLLSLAGNRSTLIVRAHSTTARSYEKNASLVLVVADLDLTDKDAESVFARPVCTPAVAACLSALPVGSVDLGSCGEAIVVRPCSSTIGVTFDDVAFRAAITRADMLLGGFGRDADAVVGHPRQAAFLGGAHQIIESRLEQLIGRRYNDATARDAASAAAIDDGLDNAFARPLSIVPAITTDPRHPGDVAADALLLYLDEHDLTMTEWARPLETLVHEYRTRHIDTIGGLRSGVNAPTETATEYQYTADWLDAYVEISVLKSTGAVGHLLFEID